MRFETITDPERLREYLGSQPIRAAYQLGDLDPDHFPLSRWFAMVGDGGDIQSLLLFYSGLSVPAVLTLGDADGVAHLFRETVRVLPRSFYLQMQEDHRSSFENVYGTQEWVRMIRMGVRRSEFIAAEKSDEVIPIGHGDTADLIKLYQNDPDHFFEPSLLDTGCYFGIREDEQLVSIAGVHVVNESCDIAALGNVLTHPGYRQKGYSLRCTSRVVETLLERVSVVALNTAEENHAARRTFKRLGFQPDHVYLEGKVE